MRRRGRPLLLAGSLAGTALFGLLQLAPLGRLAERGHGIFGFELVRTTARAQAMLSAWGPAGRDAARASLWLDFAFIACWTAALVLAGTMRRRIGTLAAESAAGPGSCRRGIVCMCDGPADPTNACPGHRTITRPRSRWGRVCAPRGASMPQPRSTQHSIPVRSRRSAPPGLRVRSSRASVRRGHGLPGDGGAHQRHIHR